MKTKMYDGFIHVADKYYMKPCLTGGTAFDLYYISAYKEGKHVGEQRNSLIGYDMQLERIVQVVGRQLASDVTMKEEIRLMDEYLILLQEVSEEICSNIKKQLK